MTRSASDQIRWATDLLRPLWHEAQQQVLQAKLMQLDATSLPVRDKEHGFGIQLGSLWAYIGDGETAVYLYASTGKKNGQRTGELGPGEFLAMRKGLTMADASNAFDQSFLRPELVEIGCNTHARRGFIKALESKDTRAAVPVAAYKRLYDIEEQAAILSDEERTIVRRQKSRPICEMARFPSTTRLSNASIEGRPSAGSASFLSAHTLGVSALRWLTPPSLPAASSD